MNESELIAALVALAKARPYAAAALALWLVLSTGWKTQPKEKRDAWAKLYPRPVSALRFALELLPDLLGAGRVFVFGILRGLASRESAPQLSSDPQSPARGVVRETDGVPPSAEQINDDGTSPAQYVSRAHVTGCDCRACASSPGFVDGAIARVIAGVALLFVGVSILAGCPMPAPDNCTPFATRCSPSGIPETCSQSQRWSHAPPASPCSSRGPVVCCRTRSPWGNELYACAPSSACLPETTTDAGAEVSDAQ